MGKIYTGTGDSGMTALFGGRRVRKDNPRIETYGTVDELNSILGLARSISKDKLISETIERVQNQLFILGWDLATPFDEEISGKVKRISADDVNYIERLIDKINGELPQISGFILPGGGILSSVLHIARTVCRRAERLAVWLSSCEKINENIIPYLNRLSDMLFVLARYANYVSGVEDIRWKK
jgi:cob(I)alamin adenosyltransferase